MINLKGHLPRWGGSATFAGGEWKGVGKSGKRRSQGVHESRDSTTINEEKAKTRPTRPATRLEVTARTVRRRRKSQTGGGKLPGAVREEWTG